MRRPLRVACSNSRASPIEINEILADEGRFLWCEQGLALTKLNQSMRLVCSQALPFLRLLLFLLCNVEL